MGKFSKNDVTDILHTILFEMDEESRYILHTILFEMDKESRYIQDTFLHFRVNVILVK